MRDPLPPADAGEAGAVVVPVPSAARIRMSQPLDGTAPMTDGAPSTVEDLHRRIRALILHGDLEPGEVVSQVQLARQFGVNRTPLREALRMLQREGLIDAEYNRRVKVAQLTTAELEQVYALRISVEAVAIRLCVPRFGPAELERLDALLAEMDALEEADFREWEVPHREFHELLVNAVGMRFNQAIDELQDHTERYRRALIQQRPISRAVGAMDHRAIVAACHARDSAEAGRQLALHLGRTALNLVSISDPLHDSAAVREALQVTVGDVRLDGVTPTTPTGR